MRTAWLGLGAMGGRMAARLPGTVLFNRSPIAEVSLVGTPREAATGADVVFSMVRDDAAAEEVWLHPERGALAGARPGAILVECSTLSPGFVARLGSAAATRGARLLDAPVVGSTPQAEAGQLVFLVGGADEDVDPVRPLLERLGSVVRIGPLGHGAAAKLVVNALFAVQLAALAEGLALAERHGLAGLLDQIGQLPVFSPALRAAGARMVAGDDAPRFPVRLVAKDLRYAVAAGAGPVVDAARAAFEAAEARGHGHLDGVAVGKR